MIDLSTLSRFLGEKPVLGRQLLWFSAALLLVPGCGPARPKGPQATVHGKVTVKGSPVPEGTVVSFMGQSKSGGSATTGADGAFRLVGPTGGQTIPVDKYKVVLMPGGSGGPPTPEQEMAQMMRDPNEAPMPKSVIPDKYQNPNTTPEEHEVKEGDNEINIDLME